MKISERKIYLALRVSLVFKGLFALMEVVGGLIFYFVSQSGLMNFVLAVTSDELSEDPKDFIANYLISLSQNLRIDARHFIALYLLSHGVVKLAAIYGLLRKKLWAYPVSFIVFIFFIIYQTYQYFFTHSFWLVVLTLIDLLVVWLIYREYKTLKSEKG